MEFSNIEMGTATPKLGTNPSRATRPTYPDRPTPLSQNPLFDRSKTGVFVTGFDPREFERATTVLNGITGVPFGPKPDCRNEGVPKDPKLESIPVSPVKKRELGSTGDLL